MADTERPGGDRAPAAIGAGIVAMLTGLAVGIWCTTVDHTSVPIEIINSLPAIGFALAGAVVAAARPRNVLGWLMLGGAAGWTTGSACIALAHHGIVVDPGSVPGAGALAVVGSIVRTADWSILTLAVPVLFPDGQVAGPRWRWLYRALAVVFVGGIIDPLTDPRADLDGLSGWRNPVAPHGAGELISTAGFVMHIGGGAIVTAAAVLQLIHRWRRGDAYRRQQLLLFACAAALTIVAAPISIYIGGGGWLFGVATTPLPLAIGFAVLAHGLYDLRTAANRTLVWLTLSVSVAGLFALVIAVASLFNARASAPWLPWIAAGVVAAFLAPLRDGLQRSVNKLTFGRWSEPYRLLAELGQNLEASADVGGLLADVVVQLEALGLRAVTITASRDDASIGDDPAAVAVPLAAYGSLVGTLRYRLPEQPLRQRDLQLLDDLAKHLGGVLHARLLTADLERARERLVLAREEERRRLRRDLHDGLGPSLAGHLLRLDVIAGLTPRETRSAELIDSLRAELRDTVAEVRRLVEGLRPPALDELGLVGALRQAGDRLLAGSRIALSVHAHELPHLPAAVEVAAYRIATEALTNVVKHSGASSCTLGIQLDDDRLVVTVCDDGVGHADGRTAGHGLHTMRERAEELRGSLETRLGREGAGTEVLACLPVPSGMAVAAGELAAGRADRVPAR